MPQRLGGQPKAAAKKSGHNRVWWGGQVPPSQKIGCEESKNANNGGKKKKANGGQKKNESKTRQVCDIQEMKTLQYNHGRRGREIDGKSTTRTKKEVWHWREGRKENQSDTEVSHGE